jgi:carnitine-CoA ligase
MFGELIDRWAAETPDRVVAVFDTGEPDWTFADLRAKVRTTARALHAAGVRRGDHVASWLENGPEAVRVWLAVSYLGAVHVPFNTAYRGGILEHVVALSGAKVMIAHATLAERLAAVDTAALTTVFTLGGEPTLPLDVRPADELWTGPDAVERAEVAPWDTAALLFTSGTTGPSKAVLSSARHLATMGEVSYPDTTREDRGLIFTPLFHITGMSSVCWALVHGGSFGVVTRYSTSTFWEDVRRVGGTFLVLQGSVATFLHALPPSEAERGTPLRMALLAPMTPAAMELCRRAGMRYYSVFNMSETSVPLRTGFDPETPYSCGVPREGVEARLVDEHDLEVPRGQVGELVLRCREPWVMTTGYFANPEATAEAWRNAWFHTGDALRQAESGEFFYVDRVKDSIRRRGENISSYEVEVEVQAHPDVEEAAAVAVPSVHGEDDVLVVVVPRRGAEIDPAELLRFLVGRMAHYMVPRYLRIVDELPRTPTAKVRKAQLRAEGVSGVWDREAVGLSVRREKVT